MADYNFRDIERQAQALWEKQGCFASQESLSKKPFYCLSMMPYPSGDLHVGHVRNYTLGDVIQRQKRLQGFEVLHPISWDAFGLPAENAAIKHGVAPAAWTMGNIDRMRHQMQSLGLGFDWQRAFATCDPEYYRWNQWLFLQMVKRGLAYRKEATVNWDPVDQTVLANEQVIDGRGWRSGALIERKSIAQWFFKITDYADELLKDLDQLEGWSPQIRTMQSHWIGRSQGVDIHFSGINHDANMTVYTTRPDTLLGVSFLAVAPEHPLVEAYLDRHPEAQADIDALKQHDCSEASLARMIKKGVPTDLTVKHPLTGQPVPVWVGNFVLMDHGTGAVMGVPAHDERDHAFALAYDLPILPVIHPRDGSSWDFTQAAYTGPGTLCNSGTWDGMPHHEAIDGMIDALEAQGQGVRVIRHRLRDWGISRQRYWGTPIPMIHCDACGIVPVPESDLPVKLPTDVNLKEGEHPLHQDSFLKTTCPQCGRPAQRETDTMDTFVDSSWYYARLACPDQHHEMLDKRANYWTPVDQYVGGIEHAILHLLYARFIHKVLRDMGLVHSHEPFTRLLSQGMVIRQGAKMSKSKGNVVAPMPLINRFGADTMRFFILFAAPPEQSLEWNDHGVEGAHRFLKRVWQLGQHLIEHQTSEQRQEATWSPDEQGWRCGYHTILQQVLKDYERMQYNTVASGCMKLLNELTSLYTADLERMPHRNSLLHDHFSVLLRLLHPMTPHLTEILWRACGYGDQLLSSSWPTVDTRALETTSNTWVLQINGKKKGDITLPARTPQSDVEEAARSHAATLRALSSGQSIHHVIVVGQKLVNLVVK